MIVPLLKSILISFVVLNANLAEGSIVFTGNESVNQIVDKLKSDKSGLYTKRVVIYSAYGSHEGFIAGMGNAYLILESDTGKSTIDDGPPKKILVQKLIAISSITAIEFMILK